MTSLDQANLNSVELEMDGMDSSSDGFNFRHKSGQKYKANFIPGGVFKEEKDFDSKTKNRINF